MIRYFIFRCLVLLSIPAALCVPSLASDKSKQDAATAAAALLAIAYQCQATLPPDAVDGAQADGLLTLAAGGYTPQDAKALIDRMMSALKEAPPKPLPGGTCGAIYKDMSANRAELRSKLEAAR